MLLSREKLRENIKDGRFEPVYVLYGEETFLRDNAASTISKFAFERGELREFNEDRFSLANPENIKSALAAANQLPMMAARRVVRITEVRVASSASRDTLKEDAADEISAYLADPCRTTIVVFVADELNGSRRLGKLLKSQAAAVEFKKPDTAELCKWAKGVFDKAEVAIEPNALLRLAALSGCDVRRVTTEANKLITAAYPQKVVDLRLVESMVRDASEIGSFDFADHLIAGRKDKAILSLRKSLSDGEEPVALLGVLGWKFRDEVKRFDPARGSAFSDRFAFALQRIAETDLAIKTSVGGSGRIGTEMQLEMLVCELAM